MADQKSNSFTKLHLQSRWLIVMLISNIILLIIAFSLPSKKMIEEVYNISEELLAVGSVDPDSKLIIDEGYILIKQQCQTCHNLDLVKQNFFTREVWLEKIRWMQATQNLWDLGENEEPILNYLAKYYSPSQKDGGSLEFSRRANLNTEWYILD